MGKQINFFIYGKDELSLIEYVKTMNDILLDYYGNEIDIQKLNDKKEENMGKYDICFIYQKNALIFKRKAGGLEQINSEVIQYTRSILKNKTELWNGRFWFENNFFDELGNKRTKPKWLSEKYKAYSKWIKANCRQNNEKDFFIGDEAYKLYKQKGYKMMNSPKVAIDFE